MDLSSNESIAKFAKLFSKLSLREQILAIAALAAILYFVLDLALLAPQKRHIKEWQQQVESNRTQLQALSAADTATLAATPSGSQSEVATLQKQIADANALLLQPTTGSHTETLVTRLLASNPKVTIVSLNTLPVSEFYTPRKVGDKDGKSVADASPSKPIYKRSVQVALKGNYLSLLGYLQTLQASPQQLFWGDAKLDASKYPDAVLNVTINTLSDTATAPLH